ncbi:MAG TPA: protein kinase [Kofleriaceae bacterium]
MTELPTTFCKYFLTEKLATGGMAEIYLAKLVGPGGFEKPLVIKQIHPKLTGQRHFVDLFVAEAKTLVTLAHGNIVPVYELGVIDDRYFIAMEYIDGPTLYRFTETLARRDVRMEPAIAAWITARILEGLDYAHRKGEGVIHRDLSPRNVMLSRDGEVKLVDFGIAVTLGEADDGVEVQSAPTGSFPYMSPEQVRREPLTGQTDLFSVGVLLWEMLVGKRLFARPDPEATLAAVTGSDIPMPSSQRDDIPPKLDEVAMRALERDQTGRWRSAGEMLDALQRYLYALEDTPGPRDLAALVARYCPPESRRLPTHSDPAPPDTSPSPPPGPHTAVIERPKGKQRARTETFATNIDLRHMLERATPLFPIPAIDDAPDSATDADPPAADQSPQTKVSAPRIVVDAQPQATPTPIPGRQPPSRGLLVIAAIGTIAVGVIALVMFLKSRESMLGPDAAPKLDRPFYFDEPDARGAAVDAPALGSNPATDGGVDAVIDAPVGLADAGPRNRDGGAATPDAGPKIAGIAKLKIGADPWGEIYIDGTARGRTPAVLEVPAGKHVVEIVYRGEDPPKKKSFTVDLAADETKPLQADFTD